jgi:hypothetical protein
MVQWESEFLTKMLERNQMNDEEIIEEMVSQLNQEQMETIINEWNNEEQRQNNRNEQHITNTKTRIGSILGRYMHFD